MNYSGDRNLVARALRSLAGILLFISATLSAVAGTGFSIKDGFLFDGNGNEFVMRGVNFPHVWFPTQTATGIPNIAATGANCVRLVLGAGAQWGPNSAADVAALIELCKANKLIAVLEVHDCTGFGDTGGFARLAAPMSVAVDYWLSIQNVLKGQEDFVIINIANEPLGNGVPAAKWISDHTTAITRLRAAGLTHTIMVDAANWGQDWEQIMLNNAGVVFQADPLKNVIFSVHMYQIYAARSTIQNYLTTFVTAKLPILVGEFGADHQGEPVDEGSILEICQTLGLGYMGWSWSGNSGGTESLDITLNFNPAMLSTWGTTLIKSPNGITATSQLATVFGDVPRLSLAPGGLSFTAAGGTTPVAVKTNRAWTVTENLPWITVTPTSGTGAVEGSISVTAAPNTEIAPRSGVITIKAENLTRTLGVSQIGTGGPGVCANAVPIPLPFVQNGIGDFCWVTSGTIASVNCWSTQSVEINGVSFTNKFSNVMPPRIDGKYFIRYSAGVSFAHLEIAGSGTVTTVPVTGVSLAPATLSLAVGASSTLTATIAPATATNKSVNWTSSNPAVATVNSSGAVTAVANGTTTITATTQDGGFTATSSVVVSTIGGPAVTGVTVTPATVSLSLGGTAPLTATVAPATAANKAVTWVSSSPAVATVSATGVVTAVGVGTTTVTARTVDGGFTASSTVTVSNIIVTPTLTVTPSTVTIAAGGTATLTATVIPANAPNRTVTWTSSNLAVATVSSTGIVTGVTAGTATITATLAGGTTATAAVIVTGINAIPCANPVVSALPLTRDGAGEFCFAVSGNVAFINSWNMQKVEINGVDFTNKWSNSLPPRINGNYYIRYSANVPWAHLEVK